MTVEKDHLQFEDLPGGGQAILIGVLVQLARVPAALDPLQQGSGIIRRELRTGRFHQSQASQTATPLVDFQADFSTQPAKDRLQLRVQSLLEFDLRVIFFVRAVYFTPACARSLPSWPVRKRKYIL